MTTKNLYEVFDEFEQRTTKADRLAVLRFNSSWALKNILKGTFDPNVQFVFESAPEYRPSDAPAGMGYTTLHQEVDRLYLFEKNNPKVSEGLTQKRKEILLIQVLESLEARASELRLGMLLKKQNIKGLNYSLVKEAFPELLP